MKMKIKEFFRRWKEGIKTLPPSKQLSSKLIGHYGTIAGFIIGFTLMFLKGMWYFSVLGFFLVWLQVVQAMSTYKQLARAKEFEKLTGEVNEEKNKTGVNEVYP